MGQLVPRNGLLFCAVSLNGQICEPCIGQSPHLHSHFYSRPGEVELAPLFTVDPLRPPTSA